VPVVGGAAPYKKVDLWRARWRAEADDCEGWTEGLFLGSGVMFLDLPRERPRLMVVGRGILHGLLRSTILANEKMIENFLASKMWVLVLMGDPRLGRQKPTKILKLITIYTGKWE